MARILSVTSGFPSILYPSVELARRLAAAGHSVTFAGLPHARALAEHHRLAFRPLGPSRYEEFLEADARTGTLDRLRNLRARRERAREALAVDGFARDLRKLEPDLVLIDGEMHEHIIAALGAGVRLALLNSFVSIWRQPGLPPPHHLVRPGVGWKGTGFGISLLWLELRLRKRLRAALNRVRRVGCDRVSILRHLAHEEGFDLWRDTDASQWLIPFTYRRLPVLSLHALEFELPHRPPERVHYVGPMLLESRIDRTMAGEDQAELDAILQRRQSQAERRLIYAGFGSAASTELAFLRRLLGVVAERPEWELLLSLGGRIAPEDLGPLPPGVHAFPWVPQLRVLRHADVMVTHGGINSIDECVLSSVPMLIYCGFETDMAGNTARVEHHCIGRIGDRRRDRTSVICERIDRLLHDPRVEKNLMRLRERYLAYAVERVAERVVDRLLDREPHDPTI